MNEDLDFSQVDPEELWARFRPSDEKLDRGRKERQLNLRVDHLWLDRLKAVAAHRDEGPYSLARTWLAEGLINVSSVADLSQTSRHRQNLQFNFRVEPGLLASLKAKASQLRVPYHSLARVVISRRVDSAWSEIMPHREPLDLQQLMVLLLGAPGSHGQPHAPVSGATAADKLLFLISRAIPPRLRPSFEPFHFGPWDETILDTERALLASGLVAREDRPSDTDEDDDEDEFSHRSLLAMSGMVDRAGEARPMHLTQRGIRAAEEWKIHQRLLDPADAEALLSVISTIKQRYGGLANDALIEEVYRQYPAYASKSRLTDNPGHPDYQDQTES